MNIILKYVPFPIFILLIYEQYQKLIFYIILDFLQFLLIFNKKLFILELSSPICYLYAFSNIIKFDNAINVPVLPTPALFIKFK